MRPIFRSLRVFLGLSVFLLTSCSQAVEREPELYVLPGGFAGSFHIVFNVPRGEPQTYEGPVRTYQIPPDGMLLMQSDTNAGRLRSDKIKFIYQSDGDVREKIDGRWTTSLHDTPENRSDDQVYIFGGGIGIVEPVRHCQLYSKSFYIGTKSQALDDVGYFDIYSERGLDKFQEEVFLGACDND